MIDIYHVYIISSLLLCIGIMGLIMHRRNLLVMLMCLELLLLAISTQFIAFSILHNNLHGQIMVIFVLAVAAAESAIGLALLMSLYRKTKSITVDGLHMLKG